MLLSINYQYAFHTNTNALSRKSIDQLQKSKIPCDNTTTNPTPHTHNKTGGHPLNSTTKIQRDAENIDDTECSDIILYFEKLNDNLSIALNEP